MGQKLLFASFSPKDKEAQDTILRHLHAIADNALAKEPGVLKYIITTAKEESTDPAIYVIEEYADEAALQIHNQQGAVKEMIKWLGLGVLKSDPIIRQLELLERCSNFTRPEVANHAGPLVVFSEVEYKPDTASKTHAYWEDIVNTSRAERPGTLVYGVWKDINQPNKLFIFHAYENMDYLMKVHVPRIRVGLRPWMLQTRGGYSYKDRI
ncbi:hypothetical protein GGI42DRAFT_342936 [Trichoderma sp. SZMC 28013]